MIQKESIQEVKYRAASKAEKATKVAPELSNITHLRSHVSFRLQGPWIEFLIYL